MIILHNPHDKVSREFVEAKRPGDEVLLYPECVSTYPNISSFPSVVLNVPKHKVVEDLDGEQTETIVEAYTGVFPVSTWAEVEEKLAFFEANKI